MIVSASKMCIKARCILGQTIFLVSMLILLIMGGCDESANIPIIEEAFWNKYGCVDDFWGVVSIGFNSKADIFIAGERYDYKDHIRFRTIYSSRDGGYSWKLIFDHYYCYLGISPEYCNLTQLLFVSSKDHIYVGSYRSVDNGDSWEQMPIYDVSSMAEDTIGQLYALATEDTVRGIYTSMDDGETWDILAVNEWGVGNIAINSEDEIFVYGYYEIWRSIDNGETWEMLKDDFAYPIYQVVIGSDGYMFAKGGSGILYRSADKGETWEDVSIFYTYQGSSNIAISSQGYVCVAVATDYVLCSMDNCKSWFKLGKGLYIEEIAIDPDDRIVCVSTGCLYGGIVALE